MKLTVILFGALLTFIVLIPAHAQDDSTRYRKSYYAYLGRGVGGQKRAGNFGLIIQVTKGSVVALTAQGTSKADTEGVPFLFDISPVKQITSSAFSVMYGKIIKRRWGHCLAMVGLSQVYITKYEEVSSLFPPNYEGEDEAAYGLTIQGGVVPSWKFAGITLNGFVHVNGLFTHGGVTLGLALGSVNFKKRL